MATLDQYERRGRLHYSIGDDVRTIEGNFRLSVDGRTVEARKVRGRNRWQLCAADSVVMFVEEVK